MLTNRRHALAGALALVLARTRPGLPYAAAQNVAGDAMHWLPALPADESRWPTWVLAYADIAGYFATRGIERPDSLAGDSRDTWIELGERIPADDGVLFRFPEVSWPELVGFSFPDVEQLAVALDPPGQIRYYAGRFDPKLIEDRLTAAGYTARASDEFTVLDSPDDKLDLANGMDRYTVGAFKHFAASPQLVVATRFREHRDAALEVLGAEAQSFADAPEFAALSNAAMDLTGYLLLNGGMLGPDGRKTAPASGSDIPPARLLLGGIHFGRDQELALIVDLVDVEAAVAAVPVIEARIEREVSGVSGVSYAEFLAGYRVEALPLTGLVRITVPNEQIATRWMRMIYTLDMTYLATS